MANTVYRLDTVRFQNYRCYGEDFQTVQLGSECTVIIGYNGAGKTAFLSGIKKAASFILSKDRRRSVSFIGDGKDVRETLLRVEDVRYHYATGLSETDYHYPCGVSLSGMVMGLNLAWDYQKPDKRTSLDKMAFRPQLDAVLERYAQRTEDTVLPLLAFFSDCYPHVRADLSNYEKDVIVNKSNQIERRAGYYRWDATSTDFYFWRDLFCKALQQLNHPTTGLQKTRNRLAHEQQSSPLYPTLMQHLNELQSAFCQTDYVMRIIKQFTRTYPTQDNRDFAVEDVSVGSYLDGSKEVFTLMFHFSDGKHIWVYVDLSG
ncbi:antigen PgaA [gut metagenome]|uniref:Antigen PgaA n=1 Tax=gut metagenome TaxID=749906 RepID=J9FBL5_9ZZZZ